MKAAIEDIIDQRVMQIVKQYVDPLITKLESAIANTNESKGSAKKTIRGGQQDGV
jgi:hypothetical protein